METRNIKISKGIFLIDSSKIFFRLWNETDAEGVRQVLKESWKEAYSPFIPQLDLDFYLEKTYNINSLIELSKNSNYICYVSEYEDVICGWLKLSLDKLENRFYLSSIYVLPDFQKNKIGEKFFQITCEEATKNNFKEIYIGVMTKNANALNWYKKLGFVFFEEEPFTMGNSSVTHLIGRLILSK